MLWIKELTRGHQVKLLTNELDALQRAKDLQIFITSMIGLACTMTSSILLWFLPNEVLANLERLDHAKIMPSYSNSANWIQYLTSFLQAISLITTLMTCVLVLLKYIYRARQKRLERFGMQQESTEKWLSSSIASEDVSEIFGSTFKWKLGLEYLAHIFQPVVWFLDYSVEMYEILQILMFLRLYLIVLVLHSHSEAYKRRVTIIESDATLVKTNFQIGPPLTMKIYFFEHTLLVLIVTVTIVLVTTSLWIFMIERHSLTLATYFQQGFARFENALWFSYVTFTTIGYGDYFPKTVGGRIVSCLIGIVGISVISLFGGVVTNRIRPNREQLHIAHYLSKQKAILDIHDTAARLIQCSFRLNKTGYGRPNSFVLYNCIKRFRRARSARAEAEISTQDPVLEQKVKTLYLLTQALRQEIVKQHVELEDLTKAVHGAVESVVSKLGNSNSHN